jgi:hypothetical protein
MRPAVFRFDPSTGMLSVRELYGSTGASYKIDDNNDLVISSAVGEYSVENGYVHLLLSENEAFATSIKLSSRTLTCRGALLSPGGVTIDLTSAQIVGFQIDESCADAALPLGSARAAKLTLRLNNSTKEWLGVSLDGYKLTLELGILLDEDYVYAPIGEYIIEAGRAQEQDTVATYTGSDRMAGTMLRAFTDSAANYPCTVLQLLQRAALQAQITLATTSFVNSGVTIPAMPVWPDKTTLRDVAGYVACLACGFARIGRTGELEIVSISNVVDAAIGPDRYKTLDKPGNTFGPLNALLVAPYGAPDGTAVSRYAVDAETADSAANAVQISENPLLAYSDATAGTLAAAMLSALSGLTVNASAISWQGDPIWECGDRIAITDLSNNAIETIITKQTLTFGNGFSATSKCTIDGVTKSESRERSNRIITPEGNLNASKVVGPMDLMRIWMHASDSFVDAEIINGKGAIRENTNPESPYYGATYEGPGFTAFANEKDGEGNWIWRIGITPRGIAGDQVWIETESGVFLSAKGLIEDHEGRIGDAESAITPTAIVNTVRSSIEYGNDLASRNRTFLYDGVHAITGMNIGDLRIDRTPVTGKNKLTRWNGTIWDDARDAAVAVSEQTATQMTWIVASGSSQANMTLTDRLYQLMAENINLEATGRIMLAVKSAISDGGIDNNSITLDDLGLLVKAAGFFRSLTNDFQIQNAAGINMMRIENDDSGGAPQGRFTLGAPGYPVDLGGEFVLSPEKGGLGMSDFRIFRLSTPPGAEIGNDGDLATVFNGVSTGWTEITTTNRGSGNGITGIIRTWNGSSGVPAGYVRAGNDNASGKYGASFSFTAPADMDTITLKITAGKVYSGTWYGWNTSLPLKVGVFATDGTLLGYANITVGTTESTITVTINCALTASATYYIGIYDENTTILRSSALIKAAGVKIPENTGGMEPYGIYVKSNGMWNGALMSVG